MFTEVEKHEIQCPKRYLEYTEDEYFRAMRDKENPNCHEANYAVIKNLERAESTMMRAELFYSGLPIVPKFLYQPDMVPLPILRPFLEKHGYVVKKFHTTRMILTSKQSPILLVSRCSVQCRTMGLTEPERAAINLSFADNGEGLSLIEHRMAAGARVFVLYTDDGVPASYCLGEGYGTSFEIANVYTLREYRRRGYAAKTVTQAIKYARDIGYTDIFLNAAGSAAQKLFVEIGFSGEIVERFWGFKGELPQWMLTLK